MNILVVEDSTALRESLKDGLTKLGHGVDAVADGKDGLDFASYKDYDVIVLDIMLPGMDGLSVLQRLRAAGKKAHVLILSAKDQVEDRIRGLQLGADDYMVKPFSFDEVCARIGTLMRRRYDSKSPDISVGSLVINVASREVRRGQSVIQLTPGEYAILEFLVLNKGRVISAEQLLDASHASDDAPGPNVIHVMVCNLRKKLAGKSDDEVVRTRRGYGYYVE